MKSARKICAGWRPVVSAAITILLFGAAQIGAVFAQPAPQGIIGVGNGVFTGFSGVVPPPLPLPPGVLPADKTYIDLAGPSARVVDLQNMGGPPAAQLVNAPKPFTATAAQVGQVYAVALDNATPPNVYVAATSSYGLPIVVPDKDGDGRPDRVKQGAPNATFMPGLWGPAPQGGPGSIWRIDGITGAVTLFANVTLGGVPNSGPALGGLAFDSATSQLFVADRNTGMIHRFTLDGVERGTYDHGVTGRAAAGLPPVPFNPANRLDITNPAFQTENSATWRFAPKERLIYGLGVRGARLHYAVADGLWIWSVSIAPDGSLGADARIEINVPPALAPTEIAKIIFDDQGRMILGERGVPVGLYDFTVLAQESVSRVLRYARILPVPGSPPVWQPVPDEYAIGFPVQYRNANGGVAIGYRYDVAGRIDRYSCGGYLWSTGEQLRRSSDPAIAAQLATGGPAEVNGLQGNEIDLVRPNNVPPFQTYFIDYDDEFGDPAALGHMGDVAIWRICGQGFLPRYGWFSWPGWLPPWGGPPGYCPPWLITPGGLCGPPPLWCPPDQQKPGFQCCPRGTAPDAAGICQPICPGLVPGDPLFDIKFEFCMHGFDPTTLEAGEAAIRCLDGSVPDPALWADPVNSLAACIRHSPPATIAVCPAGKVKQVVATPAGPVEMCVPTPAEEACQAAHGPGWHIGLDGTCQLLCPGGGWAFPTTQCCPPGAVVNPAGLCCPYGSYVDPATGQCTPPWSCPPGWLPNPITGGCCPPGSVIDPATGACAPLGCPPGSVPNPITGGCCPPGSVVDLVTGACKPGCPPGWVPNPVVGGCCPPGSVVDPVSGKCDPPDNKCPPGWIPNPVIGGCCPPGSIVDPATGACVPPCPPGSVRNPVSGVCCPAGSVLNPATGGCCPPGSKIDLVTGACYPPNECPPGTIVNPVSGACCPAGTIPNPVTGGCCPPGSIIDTLTGQCMPPGGGCPPGSVPNPVTGGCCPPESTVVGGQCRPTEVCPPNTTPTPLTGFCCPNGQMTKGGVCCPEGSWPFTEDPGAEEQCVRPPTRRPTEPTQCPEGTILNRVTGQCMPFGRPTPPPPPPPPPPTCRQGTRHNPNTSACVPITTTPTPTACPQGMRHSPNTSGCVPTSTPPPPPTACPQGMRHSPNTSGCVPTSTPPPPTACPQGMRHSPNTSGCVPITTAPPPPPTCPSGMTHNRATSGCSQPPPPSCPTGSRHVPNTSQCIKPTPPTCPTGQRHNPQTSACAPIIPACPQGQRHNSATSQCVPITTGPTPLPPCPAGQVRLRGQCVPLTKAPTLPPKTLTPTLPPCPRGTTRNAQGQCVSTPPPTLQINPNLLKQFGPQQPPR